MASLDAKKIGYLRSMPSETSKPRVPAGPFVSMWRKLAETGHATVIETAEGVAYARTEKGISAISSFDLSLSAEAMETLTAAANGGVDAFPPPPGASRLMSSGLIFSGRRKLRTTEAGAELVEALSPGRKP